MTRPAHVVDLPGWEAVQVGRPQTTVGHASCALQSDPARAGQGPRMTRPAHVAALEGWDDVLVGRPQTTLAQIFSAHRAILARALAKVQG